MSPRLQPTTLLTEYRNGERTPEATVETVYERLDTDATNAWISVREKADVLADAAALADADIEDKPLYGVPFAVKDNIDYAELPTTAACPAYAYDPGESATVVERLRAAGALLIGKTNMDQFATGLVGTRSPYGVCRNVHNPEYISGGSSSGSAVAVARGEISFALGTDTAGSGRVPAAMNGLVGLKPTRGMVSTDGVVPACASLDCVSVFAHSCGDALLVESVAAGYDPADAYSRHLTETTRFDTSVYDPTAQTIGLPPADHLEFFGDEAAATMFDRVVGTLRAAFDETVVVDFDPFVEAAELLYGGPWLAERLAAIESFVERRGDAMHPVVEGIVSEGADYSAIETFRALHELEALKQARARVFEDIDVLVTPTTGTTYTVEEIRERPVERNEHLGYYTDYVNLLDLAAVAVPTGHYADGPGFGVTVLGEAGSDARVASVGERIQTLAETTLRRSAAVTD
ncbi:allophanate hydrolase [Halobacteriales archaeon QS_6_64_34]|nr:MAG: allophanate hydrolase [Halobacteriales archaeon QS_6_64_34]